MKNFTTTKIGVMKQGLTILAMVALFAACKNNPTTETAVTKDVLVTDTAGLYSDKNRVMKLNGVADTTITTVTTTTVQKSVNGQPVAVATEPAPAKTVNKTPARSTAKTKSTKSSTSAGTNNNTASTSEPAATEEKKKGWSKAAKGTAIGAGSGAVLGAIISKKKGKGAIIGGVLGAGVGYGVGRAKDKKAATKPKE